MLVPRAVISDFMAQDFVQSRALHVQDLAAQRQDRLEVPVTPLLGRAARGVTLHDVYLGLAGVALRAIGQLTGQADPLQGALPGHQIARLARGLAGAGGGEALVHDLPPVGRVLLQIGHQLLVHHRLGGGAHLGVGELGLGLVLELRIRQPDADDRR